MKSSIIIIFSTLVLLSCKKEAFNIDKNISDRFYIQNEGYNIPVWVRGNTSKGKILLFVQGGPGSNTLDFATIDYPNWKNTLEKEVAIAYYDHRGTGNNQGDSKTDISISLMLSDLHTTITFLQNAYNCEVIPMGHSFGGQLLYRYSIEYKPESNVNKMISLNGPFTNDKDTLRWGFRREFLYNIAQKEFNEGNKISEWQEVIDWLNETPKIKDVEGDNPWKDKDQWNDYVETLIYADYQEASIQFKDYLKILFNSSYNPLPAYLNSSKKDAVLKSLFQEVYAYELGNKLDLIEQDILIVTGEYDDICPPEEMEYFFNNIQSSNKELHIVEKAGHEIFTHQGDKLNKLILNYIQ